MNVRCFAVRCFCCKIFELHRIQMLYFRHPSFDSVLFYRRRTMLKSAGKNKVIIAAGVPLFFRRAREEIEILR